MKRLLMLSILASACGKYSAAGIIIGGGLGAGAAAGMSSAENKGNDTLVGLAVGAGIGLIVGAILDVKYYEPQQGRFQTSTPKSSDTSFATTGILEPDAR